MSKKSETRSDYFQRVAVKDKDTASILTSEHAWDILQYVHSKPDGVRPQEIAEEFEIQLNQAYDKLRMLEKTGHIKRTKQRGKPGKREERRKSLLYISGIWGEQELDEDFSQMLFDKYGEYVIKNVVPELCRLHQHILIDMRKDKDLLKWYPLPHANLCPDCGNKHQAIELFLAVLAFCGSIVHGSYEYNKQLLEYGYITRKAFDRETERDEDDPEWVLSDKPTK